MHTTWADDISFASFKGLLEVHEGHSMKSASQPQLVMANLAQGCRNELICQICTRKGHSTISCFNRHNESRFSTIHNKNRSRYKTKNSNVTENAISYPDSRAIDHITVNLHDIELTNQQSTKKGIIIANGKEILILHTEFSSYSLGYANIHLTIYFMFRILKKIFFP